MSAPYPKVATKTTFILSDSRRARLKSLAVARKTTVTDLLAEGADLVLEKYERMADKHLLTERARKAKEDLRRGLFEGQGPSRDADRIVYGTESGADQKQGRRAGGRQG
jgi:hypothetical protein